MPSDRAGAAAAPRPSDMSATAVPTAHPERWYMRVDRRRTGISAQVPLLLLHAFPLDSRMWAAVLDALPDAQAVFTADLIRGGDPAPQGPEPAPDSRRVAVAGSEPDLGVAADALVEGLEAWGIEQVVVAGVSLGGYLALAVLDRAPRLVAAVALLDTKASADDDEARVRRLRIAAEVERSGTVDEVRDMPAALLGESTRGFLPDLAREVTALIGRQDPRAVAWWQRAMAARGDRTSAVQSFAGPAVVVVGDEDAIAPAPVAEALSREFGADLVPRPGPAHLLVVPRAGHLTPLEAPHEVADLLVDLVARAAPGAVS